jgi:hypothetical protein
MKMAIEYWWSDTDSWKPKYSEKKLYQCLSVHQKSHLDLLGIEPIHPLIIGLTLFGRFASIYWSIFMGISFCSYALFISRPHFQELKYGVKQGGLSVWKFSSRLVVSTHLLHRQQQCKNYSSVNSGTLYESCVTHKHTMWERRIVVILKQVVNIQTIVL